MVNSLYKLKKFGRIYTEESLNIKTSPRTEAFGAMKQPSAMAGRCFKRIRH